MQYTITAAAIATLAAIICGASAASAQGTSVAANFTRTGAGETLLAPHLAAAGTPTLFSYGGLTEIIISGTGNANAAQVADAFYNLGGSPVGIYYGANIGYTGLPFAGGGANNIQKRMDFIETLGAVAPGTIPAYRADHAYHFVLDLPQTAGVLRFGTSDGNYADNGGAFTVSVFPVVRGAVAVPEAGALPLALLALPTVFVGAIVRRRTASRKDN